MMYYKTDNGSVSIHDDHPSGNGAQFHYCTVLFPGISRPYAYLTGDLLLNVGDWVEVPFGKNDTPRLGQIISITTCTRRTAPWPPEQTKTVLCVTDAPTKPETEAKPPLALKTSPESAPSQTPKTKSEPISEEKPTAPPVPQALSSAEEEEMALLLAEIEAEKEREKALAHNTIPSPPPQRHFSRKHARRIAAVLVCIAGFSVFAYHRWSLMDQQYEQAVILTQKGSYEQAKAQFDALDGYHDAEHLSVYCQYAQLYAVSDAYEGGLYELSEINLEHSPELQPAVDALLKRAAALDERERLEEERAAAAKKHQEEREAYYGKLPVEGMPMRCLSLTSLGSPDVVEKCLNFDHLVEDRRSYSVYWYDSQGRLQAAGYCCKGKKEEYTLLSFTYYDNSISNNSGQNSNSGNTSVADHTPSIRDVYDNPEDLYEENRDWYDDEDEAWEEWEFG